jgi:DNA ligase (NAD+)
MSTAATAARSLVTQLRAAADAYYNGGPPLMDDDTYDAAVERLRELDPANPFLEEIGAPPPTAGAVTLPHPMPSLDKIKPGEDRLRRFLDGAAAANPGGLVLSEKLDGLSALWLPATGRLYLRGDGLVGQDISSVVGPTGPQGLRPVAGGDRGPYAIRGELILPRAAGEPLARAWVNGVLHRKDTSASGNDDTAKIRFVAYEVFSTVSMVRSAQMLWLKRAGFEVPWWSAVAQASEGELAAALQTRRADSPYDTDGIVVAYNCAPKSECTVDRCRNPKDAVAFKMPLADQSATTTVRAVHWGTSNQGYMIPKLEFDPVVIGAATIQFCTAHNAKTVVEKGLGPGARIVVRRSGDVIPKLDAVLVAVEAAMPPAGTYEWVNGGGVGGGVAEATAVHIRATGAETDEQTATRLYHFLKTLEVPGAGPAAASCLVEGGIRGPKALWDAPAERLSELLGPKTGANLHKALRTAMDKTTELHLMIASSKMPRGVGDTKLRALFAVEPDPKKWAASFSAPPPGWTDATLSGFLAEFPKYESWRHAELPFVAYPKVAAAGTGPKTTAEAIRSGKVLAAAASAANAPAGTVCFTGFRDKELEAAATAAGYTVAPAITSKVTVLVVPDGDVRESEKVKAARTKGIKIMPRGEFATQLH